MHDPHNEPPDPGPSIVRVIVLMVAAYLALYALWCSA